MESAPGTTQRTVLATLWTVIAVWMAIDGYGPDDIAGPLFATILTIIIVATAIALSVSLKRESVMSVTTVPSK